MERTFANATLLSASVLTAFMIMVPINHLSAQNEIKLLNEDAKVHKAVIQKVHADTNTFSVAIDDTEISVQTDASTTVFLGNGEETDYSALKSKQSIYVFGSYDKESHSILANKIVIRNKPVTDRSNLSNVTPTIPTRYPDNTKKTLSMLGLTQ